MENETPDEFPIRNCRFRYRCHRQWASLTETATDGVRHCSDCDENVYLCPSGVQLASAIMENRCVSVPVQLVQSYSAERLSARLNADRLERALKRGPLPPESTLTGLVIHADFGKPPDPA